MNFPVISERMLCCSTLGFVGALLVFLIVLSMSGHSIMPQM